MLRLCIAVAATLPCVLPAAAQQADSAWVSDAQLLRQGNSFTEDASRLTSGGYSRKSWASWITAADMPADLRAQGFKSETYLAAEIGTDGRLTGCRVLKPSADSRLDGIACARLTANARFEPGYTAPGKPIAWKINLAVQWETASRTEVDARPHYPAIALPPPLSSSPRYSGWPRLKWEGGLQVDRFPDLQSLVPGQPGNPATGTTTVELLVKPSGETSCAIGFGSGNAVLDALACSTAQTLPLSYPEPCDNCRDRRLPLQFVWARKGSHIRVPLGSGISYESPAIARDPADTRTIAQIASVRARSEVALAPRDFADIADRKVSNPAPALALAIDAGGKLTGCTVRFSSGNAAVDARLCTLLAKRARFGTITDIFGDPAPDTETQYVRLTGLL